MNRPPKTRFSTFVVLAIATTAASMVSVAALRPRLLNTLDLVGVFWPAVALLGVGAVGVAWAVVGRHFKSRRYGKSLLLGGVLAGAPAVFGFVALDVQPSDLVAVFDGLIDGEGEVGAVTPPAGVGANTDGAPKAHDTRAVDGADESGFVAFAQETFNAFQTLDSAAACRTFLRHVACDFTRAFALTKSGSLNGVALVDLHLDEIDSKDFDDVVLAKQFSADGWPGGEVKQWTYTLTANGVRGEAYFLTQDGRYVIVGGERSKDDPEHWFVRGLPIVGAASSTLSPIPAASCFIETARRAGTRMVPREAIGICTRATAPGSYVDGIDTKLQR